MIKLKLKLPNLNLTKFIRPMVSLLLLAAFVYYGYLAKQIQVVEADQAHLKAEEDKLRQQKLEFDRQTLEEITAPPPLRGPGRNPFSP